MDLHPQTLALPTDPYIHSPLPDSIATSSSPSPDSSLPWQVPQEDCTARPSTFCLHASLLLEGLWGGRGRPERSLYSHRSAMIPPNVPMAGAAPSHTQGIPASTLFPKTSNFKSGFHCFSAGSSWNSSDQPVPSGHRHRHARTKPGHVSPSKSASFRRKYLNPEMCDGAIQAAHGICSHRVSAAPGWLCGGTEGRMRVHLALPVGSAIGFLAYPHFSLGGRSMQGKEGVPSRGSLGVPS